MKLSVLHSQGSFSLKRHAAARVAPRVKRGATAAASAKAPGQWGPGGTPQGAGAPDEPDFDDILLDDEYYKELGLDREASGREMPAPAEDLDPEGLDLLSLDDAASLGDELPDELRELLTSTEVYGPEAVVVAGFRAEEVAVVRAVLDSAGGHGVKVIPTTPDMLRGTVDAAVYTAEVDWNEPRPEQWVDGGGWGAQRTVLFSGLPVKVQATVLELLEGSGFHPLAAGMVLEDEAFKVLGDVLADAVRQHRKSGPKLKGRMGWEGSGRIVDRQTGLPSLDEIAQQVAAEQQQQRQQQQQQQQEEEEEEEEDSGKQGGGKAGVKAAWPPEAAAAAAPEVVEATVLEPPSTAPLATRASSSSSSSSSAVPTAAGPADIASEAPAPSSAGGSTASSPTDASANGWPEEPDLLLPSVDNSLDNLMSALHPLRPAATGVAPLTATGDINTNTTSASGASSVRAGAPDSMPTLQSIQAALQSGASPDELKRLIDDAYSNLQDRQQQQPSQSSAAASLASPSDASAGHTAAAAAAVAPTAAAAATGVNQQRIVTLPAAGGADTAAALNAAFGDDGAAPRRTTAGRVRLSPASTGNGAKATPPPPWAKTGTKAASKPSSLEGVASSSSGARGAAGTEAPKTTLPPVAGQSPGSAAAAARKKTFGPEPPPQLSSQQQQKDVGGGLLNLRPEVARALAQGKGVQFVDLSKLPKKYREQMQRQKVSAGSSRVGSYAPQQQQQQQQQSSSSAAAAASLGVSSAAANLGAGQQQQQHGGGGRDESELSAEELKQLVEAAKGMGQAPEQALLDALAVGFTVSTQTAAQVGLALPGAEEVARVAAEVQAMRDGDGDGVDDDGDGDGGSPSLPSAELGTAELGELLAEAKQQGLDPDRMLAEALAVGFTVSEQTAAALGVGLPSAEDVARAAADVVGAGSSGAAPDGPST